VLADVGGFYAGLLAVASLFMGWWSELAFKADYLSTVHVDIGDNFDAEGPKSPGKGKKNYISQSLIVERLGN
jgi:hypothetical protein